MLFCHFSQVLSRYQTFKREPLLSLFQSRSEQSKVVTEKKKEKFWWTFKCCVKGHRKYFFFPKNNRFFLSSICLLKHITYLSKRYRFPALGLLSRLALRRLTSNLNSHLIKNKIGANIGQAACQIRPLNL